MLRIFYILSKKLDISGLIYAEFYDMMYFMKEKLQQRLDVISWS